VESTAYFVVCEALANVAKHAHASQATIAARQADGRLLVEGQCCIRLDRSPGARLAL
jgi:glucose-6-phosphate-specific signal transduction histidine kinase